MDGPEATILFQNMSDALELRTISGIIDAAKVTRSALQNAASIAALFLTTEAVISDIPAKAAAGAGGGGMGDMDF